MIRLFSIVTFILLCALPAAAQGIRYTAPTANPSALTTATVDVTTASATGGGIYVDATLAVGFQNGLISYCTWEPVSNASVASIIVAQYADSGHTKLLAYLTGDASVGVATTDYWPRYRGMGGMVLALAGVHRSEDTNAYLQVKNTTGGQDGTIKVTCKFVRDS